MVNRILFGLGVVIAIAAVYVFFVWKGLARWGYDEVLAQVTSEFGKNTEVLAVEVTGPGEGDVAFVLRASRGRVRVRSYWLKCKGRNKSTLNGQPHLGDCAYHLRRVSTVTRAATPADRGPTVRLGELRADVFDRLVEGGKPSYTGAVLYRARWHFDAPFAHIAEADGRGVRKVSDDDSDMVVREMVGDPVE